MPRKNEDLQTVDLKGVEIMAAVGPVKGIGSPPEGDHWTPADLRAMAAAAAELADEVKPPAAIGHFPKFADPAVGELENIRTNRDATKLIGDLKDVPRKFADLVKAKAYRSRSVEMKGGFTSQKTGKTYPWVVTGLAFGGGKLPAVRTLDDVVALYEADDAESENEDGYFVQLEEFDAADVDVARLLEAVYEQASTIANLGVQIAQASEGFPGGQELRRSLEAAAKKTGAKQSRGRADTRATVAEKTYTDEQRRQFAEATGLEANKATDEMLAAAGVPLEQPTPPPDPPKPPEGDEKVRALEDRLAKTELKVEEERKRAFEAERKTVIDAALKEGRFTPGEREGWEIRYETNAEATVEALSKLKPNEELGREYGEDGSDADLDAEQAKAYEDSVKAEISVMTGVPVEAVV